MLTPERLEEIGDLYRRLRHSTDWSDYTTEEWANMVCELIDEIDRLKRCDLLAACEAALPELEAWKSQCVYESRCEPDEPDPDVEQARNVITACKVAIAKWKGEKGYWTKVE